MVRPLYAIFLMNTLFTDFSDSAQAGNVLDETGIAEVADGTIFFHAGLHFEIWITVGFPGWTIRRQMSACCAVRPDRSVR